MRIEIGPKDIQKKQVVVVRRDNGKKIIIKEGQLTKKISQLLEDIQKSLFNKARNFLKDNIRTVKNYEEFKEVIDRERGFIRTGWCGEQSCEEKIKEETGATIRTMPFKKEKTFSNCVYCGNKAKEVVYFAKAY